MKKEITQEWGLLKLHGDVVDIGWYEHITFENGKPNHLAIIILANLVYWHRPKITRTDDENIKYENKFWGDKLQKKYQEYADRYGYSKKQVQNAFYQLRDMGIVDIELRNIDSDKGTLFNVTYFEVNLEKVKSISSQYREVEVDDDEIDDIDDENIDEEAIEDKIEGKIEVHNENDELYNEFKKLPVEAVEMTVYFANKVIENFPRQPIPDLEKRNYNLLRWCKDMEKLNRIGVSGGKEGFKWEEIKEVINWCQDDEFWRGNIMSVGKLRQKFITLQGQMKSKISSNSGNSKIADNLISRIKKNEEEEKRQRGIM